jgi:hypothetical protein
MNTGRKRRGKTKDILCFVEYIFLTEENGPSWAGRPEKAEKRR